MRMPARLPTSRPRTHRPLRGRSARASASARRRRKRQGGKGRKVVGLKIGASQLAAAVVSETERGHELLGLARRPLAAGIVVDGEVRDEARSRTRQVVLRGREAAEERRPYRPLEQPHRRPNLRHRRRRGREPLRQRRPLQGARGAPGRASRVGARLSRARGAVGEDGEPDRAASCSSSRRATRSSRTPRVANRAGIRLDGIDLEALGLLRAFVEPGTGASDRRRHRDGRRLDRPRVVDAARRRRRGLRVHPRLRLGRKRARGSDRRGARGPAGRGGHDSPAPLALGPGRQYERSTR